MYIFLFRKKQNIKNDPPSFAVERALGLLRFLVGTAGTSFFQIGNFVQQFLKLLINPFLIDNQGVQVLIDAL
nr:MAG TPA: hypothetical protein [Caudoviricetes sp.]